MTSCLHAKRFANAIIVTPKYRAALLREAIDLGEDVRRQLEALPVYRNYVCVDLADPQLRQALLRGSRIFTDANGRSLPAALIGTARRVVSEIREFERRAANSASFAGGEPGQSM